MPYTPPPLRLRPRLRSATWYGFPDGPSGTSALSLNQARYTPFLLPEARTFTDIGVEVSTVGAATSTIRLGIYRDTDGLPGAAYLDAGTVAGNVVGLRSITTTFTLSAGIWWAAIAGQGSSTMPTVRTVSGFGGAPFDTAGTGSNSTVMTQSSVSGAFPATATPVGNNSTGPQIRLKPQ